MPCQRDQQVLTQVLLEAWVMEFIYEGSIYTDNLFESDTDDS